MMGLVAIVVAVVILVFFAFGYVFGCSSSNRKSANPLTQAGFTPR